MPNTYEKFGVKFLYPENWKIGEEQASYAPYEVSLQCPGGGFWLLRVYPGHQDFAVLLDEVVDSMKAEYEDIESEPFSEMLDGTAVQGNEMNFYYLDLLITAKSYCFSAQGRTYFVHAQAESREFDETEPVFRAMTLSLLRAVEASDA